MTEEIVNYEEMLNHAEDLYKEFVGLRKFLKEREADYQLGRRESSPGHRWFREADESVLRAAALGAAAALSISEQ